MLGRDAAQSIERLKGGRGRAVETEDDARCIAFCSGVDELLDDERGAVVDVLSLGEVQDDDLVADDVVTDGADELA